MLGSLNSAVSGMQQFQNELDVIGNNIANANTVGFKSASTNFEDTFSQTMQADSGGETVQVGTGVATAAITNNFNEGTISSTGVKTNLAVDGSGFFVVRDPASGQDFVTRAGDFAVDQNGYLVTPNGYRVQGYSDAGLTTNGDLLIDGTGAPATTSPTATVADYNIGLDGKITVTMSDGTSFVRGQVLLQSFSDPQALLKEGCNLYSGITLAGPLGGTTPQPAAPGTAGLGQVRSSALEQSNVDLTNEFANLITAQRAFQANARVVTTSDEILQELVQLKR